MSLPLAKFSYSPLSGKTPLKINFINESKNLGATDIWSSCSINKRYHISSLSDLSDIFALDFSEWNNEGIKQTYDINGFKIESSGAYYPNLIENPLAQSPIKTIENLVEYPIISIDDIIGKLYTEQINIDLTKDFTIEMTIVEFDNYHGSIELYFENLKVNDSYNNPGIHINTGNGVGIIKSISNSSNVAYVSDYKLPIIIKLKKENENLYLYIDDNIVYQYSAAALGVGTSDIPRNMLCPLKLKVSTQNNVSNWVMHIKDIYIVTGKEDNNSNLVNIGSGFSAQYLWNFDDSIISTEENPYHYFMTRKMYNVSLTVTNEYGSDTINKIILISSDVALINANTIFLEKNSEVVRNLDSIPNYCSNQRLNNIINAAIYDAIRYADTLLDNITIRFKFTLDPTLNENRKIKCETNYISDLNNNLNLNNEYVVRTLVEINKRGDLVNVEFNLSDPT
jgi:hypothetical protein